MNRTTVKTTLHFDLGFVSDSAPVKLHVGTERVPLLRHTPESLAHHRAGNAALRLIPDESIRHYAEDIELPREYVQLLLVTTAPKVELDKNLKPSDKNYYNWSDITKEWVIGSMSDSVKKAKNEPSLQSTSTNAGVYTVQEGVTNVSVPQSQTLPRSEARALDDSSSSYWTVNNLTPQHGFSQSGHLSFENNTFKISFTNS